jgi:hypothetical protein
MTEKILAAVVIAVCVLLFARLLLSDRRRWRFDNAVRAGALRLKRTVDATSAAWRQRGVQRRSKKVADEVIRRARGGVSRDGNVYRPKSFTKKPPRDKDKLH